MNGCGRTFVSAPNQVLFALGWAMIDLRPTCTNLLNPTSERDGSHPCLISLWPKEGCTVVCRSIFTHPKANNTLLGAKTKVLPQKSDTHYGTPP